MKKTKNSEENSNPSFEEGMAILESIANDLSGDELSLDQALEKFEKGVGLVRKLNDILDGYEKKIEYIVGGDKKEAVD